MNHIRITIATCSAIGLYTIGCVIWKRLKNYKRVFRPDEETSDFAELPRELWLDILEKYLTSNLKKEDILKIALIDKAAYQFVEKIYAEKLGAPPSPESRLCITPKLRYFMDKQSKETRLWLSVGETTPIYGPWMESNPLKAPETFFKFIALLIQKPVWFKFYLTSGSAMKQVIRNFVNIERMSPLVGVIRVRS
jgi:hypothetical protein